MWSLKLNMNKEYRKLSELKVWDKNPRTISKEAFERLKWQLEKLGEYKPLLVNQDNIVLGGNMRLKAYTEMGKDKLWVSPVVTKNEAEMWEYALSDNDPELGRFILYRKVINNAQELLVELR
mgnify:CR=1 FL=1